MKVVNAAQDAIFQALNSEAAWLTAHDPQMAIQYLQVVFLSIWHLPVDPWFLAKFPGPAWRWSKIPCTSRFQPVSIWMACPTKSHWCNKGWGGVIDTWLMALPHLPRKVTNFWWTRKVHPSRMGSEMELICGYLCLRSAEASWSSSTKQRRFRVFKDWVSFIIPRVWDKKYKGRPKCKNVICLRILTNYL